MNFPQEQAYSVHASNGWQDELNYVEGDSSVATAGGTWRKVYRMPPQAETSIST